MLLLYSIYPCRRDTLTSMSPSPPASPVRTLRGEPGAILGSTFAVPNMAGTVGLFLVRYQPYTAHQTSGQQHVQQYTTPPLLCACKCVHACAETAECRKQQRVVVNAAECVPVRTGRFKPCKPGQAATAVIFSSADHTVLLYQTSPFNPLGPTYRCRARVVRVLL